MANRAAGLALSATLAACAGGGPDAWVPDTDAFRPRDSEVEPERVAYAEVQAIFDQSCATSGCHDGTAPPLLTAGASPASIVSVASEQLPTMAWVEPGNAEESYLFLKVRGDFTGAGGSGLQMPSTACCLSDEEVARLAQWIDEGAVP